MGFLEAQLTDKQWWLYVDGNIGGEYIPADLFNVNDVRAILDDGEGEGWEDKLLAIVGDYLENTRISSAELIHGYGVRSSAPGYMDCTSWSVYTSKREAVKAYNQENRECEGLD